MVQFHVGFSHEIELIIVKLSTPVRLSTHMPFLTNSLILGSLSVAPLKFFTSERFCATVPWNIVVKKNRCERAKKPSLFHMLNTPKRIAFFRLVKVRK